MTLNVGTPTTADLRIRARAAIRTLVRSGTIRQAWLPGMRGLLDRGITGGIIPFRRSDTIPGGWWFPSDLDLPNAIVDRDALPDATDPLTAHGLVLLAGEAWKQPYIRPDHMEGYDGYDWILPIVTNDPTLPHTRSHVTWFPGETEAECAIVALEAAAARIAKQPPGGTTP